MIRFVKISDIPLAELSPQPIPSIYSGRSRFRLCQLTLFPSPPEFASPRTVPSTKGVGVELFSRSHFPRSPSQPQSPNSICSPSTSPVPARGFVGLPRLAWVRLIPVASHSTSLNRLFPKGWPWAKAKRMSQRVTKGVSVGLKFRIHFSQYRRGKTRIVIHPHSSHIPIRTRIQSNNSAWPILSQTRCAATRTTPCGSAA